MAQDGTVSGYPGDGWQQRMLPVLAGLAAADTRIRDFQVHGSASGPGAPTDQWSDLDVLITAVDPVTAAEDLARQIGRCLSPVFAANRSGDSRRYCVRLVLRDLRRIDVTAIAAPGDGQDREPAERGQGQPPADAVAELIGNFRFDAVLAAVKAARGDVLIGAHLTLQLARHVLEMAMLLRDQDAGTTHHRFGGSRWDEMGLQTHRGTCSIHPSRYHRGYPLLHEDAGRNRGLLGFASASRQCQQSIARASGRDRGLRS